MASFLEKRVLEYRIEALDAPGSFGARPHWYIVGTERWSEVWASHYAEQYAARYPDKEFRVTAVLATPRVGNPLDWPDPEIRIVRTFNMKAAA